QEIKDARGNERASNRTGGKNGGADGGETEIERDHCAQSGGGRNTGDAGFGERVTEQALQCCAARAQCGTDEQREGCPRQADFARDDARCAMTVEKSRNQLRWRDIGGAEEK